MIPTKAYIEERFDTFNKKMFGGKLPKIPIELSNAKTFLGKLAYNRRRTKGGKTENYNFRLRINTRIDLPEQEIEDTILHEMIHYYIGVNQFEDTSSHGKLFMSMMNGINARYGRHISVSFKGTAETREQFVDKRARYHVVAVVHFHDGCTGIKVLPRIVQRITHYYNTLSDSNEVETVELYMTNDIFFNRYPTSSALKAHLLDEQEIRSHLTDAERLGCDGTNILRNQ